MDDLEKAVRGFHSRVLEAEMVYDALNSVMWMEPESNFHSMLSELIGGYKEALDTAFHIGGWLEWWWLDCDLGRRRHPKEAGLPGEPLRKIATVDDLVKIIKDDLARAV